MKLETKLKNWDLRKWKKEFDKVFALYVKERDNWICFTCGRKGDRSNIQNGHYIPRGACGLELYFHEDNCHAQCSYCNHVLEGNTIKYKEKLGEKTHKKLYDIFYKRNNDLKYSKMDYVNLIEEYEAKIEQLKHERRTN